MVECPSLFYEIHRFGDFPPNLRAKLNYFFCDIFQLFDQPRMIQRRFEIFSFSRFNMKISWLSWMRYLKELLYCTKLTYNGVKKSVLTIGKIMNVDQIVSIWGTVIDRLSFSFESMYNRLTIMSKPELQLYKPFKIAIVKWLFIHGFPKYYQSCLNWNDHI